MSDTIEHTNGTHSQAPEHLTGRKLANAMNLLLSDLADAIDERFPHNGKAKEGDEDSAEYVNNHAAHAAAYKLIEALLLVQPKHHEHRTEMFRFAMQAWDLYGARTDQDDVVRKCIERAGTDYKPVRPEQLARGKKTEDEGAESKTPGKADAKSTKKTGGQP